MVCLGFVNKYIILCSYEDRNETLRAYSISEWRLVFNANIQAISHESSKQTKKTQPLNCGPMQQFSCRICDVTPKSSSKWRHTYDHQAATDSCSPQPKHRWFFQVISTLTASHVPGTILGSGDSAVDKTGKAPAPRELTV